MNHIKQQLLPARRIWTAMAFVLSAGIIVSGYLYFRSESRQRRAEAEKELSVIADLKVQQIAQWRRERLGDAAYLRDTPYVARRAVDVLKEPTSTSTRQMLDASLKPFIRKGSFDHLLLLDERLNVRWSYPPDASAELCEDTRQAAGRALNSREVVESDLHRETEDGPVYLSLIVPFVVRREGVKENVPAAGKEALPGDRSAGVLVMQINAHERLYPMVQTWPTPSATAETLLARREGEAAVFLNELWHRRDAALKLRVPLTNAALPAVRGVLGASGVLVGRDYRGVPVLSAVKAIPETPWVLVAKMDEKEILTDAWLEARFLGLALAALLLLVAAGTAYGYRRQQAGLFQGLYESERRQREAQALYRATLYSIGDAVITTDTECRVQTMNPVAEKLTGWPEAGARGKPLNEVFRIVNAENRAALENPVQLALREDRTVGLTNQALLLARDGAEHPVADSAAPIRDEKGIVSGAVLVFSDQTERYATRRALCESEERVRLALSAADQGLYDLNVQTGECVVSPEYARMLGYDPAEFQETNAAWRDRLHPEDRETVYRIFEEYVQGQRTEYRVEFRQRTKSGDWKWILSLGKLVSWTGDGRPLRMLGTHTDITERKRAEQAVRESEEKLRQIVEHSSQLFYAHTPDHRLTYVSPQASQFFDCTPQEALRQWTDFVTDNPINTEGYELTCKAIQTGQPQQPYQLELKSKTGRILWVEVHESPVVVEGRTVAIVGALTDITERKQAEEGLRRERILLRTVVDLIPDPIYAKDRRGAKTLANRAEVKWMGLETEAEALGKRDSDIYPPEIAKGTEASDREIIETGIPILNREEPVFDAQGQHHRVLTSKMPLRDEQGVIMGLVGISHDITELKQAESRLRLQSSALEAAANAIVITSPEGTIQWVNVAFTTLTGYDEHEALGKKPGPLLKSGKHEQNFYQNMWDTILEGRIWHGEVINRRKDGSLYTEDMTITPIKEGGRIMHFIAVKQDITKRKALEEQLRQSQKMEAIGQLAGGVAHDFNNMLGVIQGHASLLQMGLPSEQRAQALQQIAQATERAAHLTRQLLTFSRRQTMQAVPLNLNEVVSGMVKMLHRIIGEDIALQTRLLGGGAPVHGDPGMIEQVLLNLAVNARDAMPKGGEIAIELSRQTLDEKAAALRPSSRPGDFIRLTFRDTGCGITPEHLPHIFEPFFTTKDVGKGTGLGLATVHGIVAQHQGWIEVESQPDGGTTFHIHLPRLTSPKQVQAATQITARVRGGTETILLVEDELALRSLAVRLLERYGYRVLEAPSGAAALELWREHRDRVDLLLTDIIMPEGVSGRELVEQLRADKPGLLVIFMSGYPGEVAGRGLNLREGVNFLQKPFGVVKLAQTVRDCLDAAKRGA